MSQLVWSSVIVNISEFADAVLPYQYEGNLEWRRSQSHKKGNGQNGTSSMAHFTIRFIVSSVLKSVGCMIFKYYEPLKKMY